MPYIPLVDKVSIDFNKIRAQLTENPYSQKILTSLHASPDKVVEHLSEKDATLCERVCKNFCSASVAKSVHRDNWTFQKVCALSDKERHTLEIRYQKTAKTATVLIIIPTYFLVNLYIMYQGLLSE